MNKKRLSPLLMVVGVALVNYAIIAIAVRAGGIVPTVSWLVQAGACIAAGVAAVCWGFTLRPSSVEKACMCSHVLTVTTTINRESAAEGAVDPTAGQDQGVFFL